ncbi:hypothetical protein AB0A95_18660 [Micromonospora sp. NPDC049230]
MLIGDDLGGSIRSRVDQPVGVGGVAFGAHDVDLSAHVGVARNCFAEGEQ